MKEPTKFDGGKTEYHLVPRNIIASLARVFMRGKEKYGYKNYIGLERHRVYDALQRHLDSFLDGEWVDEDTGEPHLACVIANVVMMWENEVHDKETMTCSDDEIHDKYKNMQVDKRDRGVKFLPSDFLEKSKLTYYPKEDLRPLEPDYRLEPVDDKG